MIKKSLLLTLVFLSGVSLFCNSFAMNVQVFTEHSDSIRLGILPPNSHVTVYDLSELSRLNARMNVLVSARNPVQAAMIARQFLWVHQSQLRHAAQGIHLINQYGIDGLPTMVFDHGAYLIKGQTDVSIALQEYRTWRART